MGPEIQKAMGGLIVSGQLCFFAHGVRPKTFITLVPLQKIIFDEPFFESLPDGQKMQDRPDTPLAPCGIRAGLIIIGLVPVVEVIQGADGVFPIVEELKIENLVTKEQTAYF